MAAFGTVTMTLTGQGPSSANYLATGLTIPWCFPLSTLTEVAVVCNAGPGWLIVFTVTGLASEPPNCFASSLVCSPLLAVWDGCAGGLDCVDPWSAVLTETPP